MYHYIEDKGFLKHMRSHCSTIINQLVQCINNDSVMAVEAHLVGSGARNLITQNANEPIDLDYNLCVLEVFEIGFNSSQAIKEYIRQHFNKVLNQNGWGDCRDSTSALTTELRHFIKGNDTEFKIDLAIVRQSHYGLERLIHSKTGIISLDQWYWNQVRDSKGLADKVRKIKSENWWLEVRDKYLEKKNMYLRQGDTDNHPSFNVYIETINEIYYKYFNINNYYIYPFC